MPYDLMHCCKKFKTRVQREKMHKNQQQMDSFHEIERGD